VAVGSLCRLVAEVAVAGADLVVPAGHFPTATTELPLPPELFGLRIHGDQRARIRQGLSLEYLASTTVQPVEWGRVGSRPRAWTLGPADLS
jgi:hypothetical protein